MPSSWPTRGTEFAMYLGQAETHQSLRPSNVILRTCLAEEKSSSSSYEQHTELNQTKNIDRSWKSRYAGIFVVCQEFFHFWGAVGCSPPFSSSSSVLLLSIKSFNKTCLLKKQKIKENINYELVSCLFTVF